MKRSMMKRTTLREIRSTFGRFAAILAIIALGVGFFSGVRVTTPAMVSMMDSYLNENQFFDYRLVSTMGWDKSSVEAFAQQDGVRFAEGGISLDTIFDYIHSGETEELPMKAHILPENIDTLHLTNGRMPESPYECIADSKKGYHVGDVFRLSASNEDKVLKFYSDREAEFTVVGVADSARYINFERGSTSVGSGTIYGFVYFPEETFDLDYYTEIYVRFDHDLPLYSDEYDSFMADKEASWETIAQEQADLRFDDVYNEAQQELSDGRAELEEKRTDGQKELDDAKKKLDDAQKELKDAEKKLSDAKKDIEKGEKELSDSKKKLDDGRAELEKGKKTLDDSKKQLDESEHQLTDGEAQLRDGQEQIDAARGELETAQAELDAKEAAFYEEYGEALRLIDFLPEQFQAALRDGLAQLEAGREQIESGRNELNGQQAVLDEKRQELEAGRAEWESGKQQYEQGLADWKKAESDLKKGEKEYEDGLKKFRDGKKDYEKGLADYEDGKKEYQDGLAEYKDGLAEFAEKIADAEKELADGEKKLSELEMPDVYLLGRSTNIGYACFESDSEIVAQVAKVFPIFFILVAALVCMTTMSRMVEEQRTQIGMFKALGYSESRIMGKFMFYSGSASMIGCILGFFGGTYLFPSIIWVTYKMMYIPLDLPYLFDGKLFAAAVAASLACSLGMTWISCRVELSETAANLMRPKAPKAGKRVLPERIPFIWNRLKFLHKVSIRNIFRYKGRFFMMIVGIGGCTALLLTGFGIKDSIAGFAEIQYDRIQTADGTFTFDSENLDAVEKLISDENADVIFFRKSAWDLVYDGGRTKSIDLQVFPETDGMDDFMNICDLSGEPLDMPGIGEAVVSHSIAKRFGAVKGSELVLRDEDMRELHLTVSGVFENHVYNYVFIGSESYTEQTGEEAAVNGGFINFSGDSDISRAAARFSGNSNIRYMERFDETRTRLTNMMSSLDYIVLLVIVCAAGLAFIVIYNLTNINITERTREIATIKVLGFFRNETSAYVLRENLALTAIGALVGLGLGILLHRFVIAQIVVDMVDFGVTVKPMSFLYSLVLTFAFNFIVNLFMSVKLEKINMAESLKSVD